MSKQMKGHTFLYETRGTTNYQLDYAN